MKKLIITANPVSTSLTWSIAEKLLELSEKKWDSVEILDLYKTDLKQDFLNYENVKEIWKDQITKKIQEKITWADELVFVFPIWWWDAPAILKNFIDSNFLPWFAYKYESWWKKIWLLKWKQARIIATSWAPGFFYKVLLHIQVMWNLNRIWFCGMKQKSFTVFWEVDRTKTDKNKIFEKLSDLV